MQQMEREGRSKETNLRENNFQRSVVFSDIFENVELTAAEMRTLEWLAGWGESTVANMHSAMRKAIMAETRRQEQTPRP